MMKIAVQYLTSKILMLFMGVLIFSACSDNATEDVTDKKPEVQEATIVSAKLMSNELTRETEVTNDEVRFYVDASVDRTKLAPLFTLAPGATIAPVNGTVRNFTEPQTYVVTSADGTSKKMYKVSFPVSGPATEFHFEKIDYVQDRSVTPARNFFQVFVGDVLDNQEFQWESTNVAYMTLNSTAGATDYPVTQDDKGRTGKCVKLATKDVKEHGESLNAHVLAGSLFLGNFSLNWDDFANSSKLGLVIHQRPTSISGYYKYKAGATLIDKEGKPIAGKRDSFDIYAVLFEASDSESLLGGEVLTSDKVVLMARVEDKQETDNWMQFKARFKSMNNANVDEQKLKNGQYKLAIVMTSSINGASFEGAVGSTLYVDEVKLNY